MENQVYDEISLRELIESLIKNKKIIAIITLSIVVLSGIYTFLLSDKIYEGKAVIQVNQSEIYTSQSPANVDELLEGININNGSTIEAYKEQILSIDVMLRVKQELELENITPNQLAKKISLLNNSNVNLITIVVKDTDYKLATDIANSVAKQFALYIGDIQTKQLTNSTYILETQLENEKEKLDNALLELKSLLSEVRDTSLIQSEINASTDALNKYKSEVITLDSNYKDLVFETTEEIRAGEKRLKAYDKLLNSIDESFLLDKNILDDAFITQLSSSLSSNLSQIMKLKISNEEINPVYVSTLEKYVTEKISILENKEKLATLDNNFEYKKVSLEENISTLETVIDNLKAEFAEREIDERLVNKRVDTAQTTYDAFYDKLELTRVAISAKVSENNIITVSEALESNIPVSPNTTLNIAISSILGLIMGIFVAFFKEYWVNTKPE